MARDRPEVIVRYLASIVATRLRATKVSQAFVRPHSVGPLLVSEKVLRATWDNEDHRLNPLLGDEHFVSRDQVTGGEEVQWLTGKAVKQVQDRVPNPRVLGVPRWEHDVDRIGPPVERGSPDKDPLGRGGYDPEDARSPGRDDQHRGRCLWAGNPR